MISNTIDLVSFNVLNPQYNISLMTFKNYSKYIKENSINKITDNNLYDTLVQFGKIEEKEFKLYRKNKLLNLIQYFIELNKIVCLQEVNDDLLITLKDKFQNIVSTKQINDDHRVVIVPFKYQIENHTELIFENDVKQKNCLTVNINLNNIKFIIFNLHIHWKSEPRHYKTYAKIIMKYLNKYNLPFIICGDYNSEINDNSMQFFIKQINKKYSILTNDLFYKNNFTSINTKSPPQTGWIDHFLTYGFQVKKSTTTKNKIYIYNIYYDALKIIKLLLSDMKNIKIFNSNKYISDHKPIFISLYITPFPLKNGTNSNKF